MRGSRGDRRAGGIAEPEPAQWAGRLMDPPHYPRLELGKGVGALVMLLVRLDDEGKVAQAATHAVKLLGEEVSPRADRQVRAFTEAAEQAAQHWRIPGMKGQLVMVPVRSTVGVWGRGWEWPIGPDAVVVDCADHLLGRVRGRRWTGRFAGSEPREQPDARPSS